MTGPLAGTRVLELAAQGPGPFACMLLADLGAEVVTVERVGAGRTTGDAHSRGRRYIGLDLKDSRAAELLLRLVDTADALVEGFRAGVMERLGLGPDSCARRNPRLVYGRVTGWGQEGPLAHEAGHDINYLALSGALDAIGPIGGPPVPPLNLLGDYAGGGFLLALGITAALHERTSSGKGQVVDAAMVDGLAAMLAPFHAMSARGAWDRPRGENVLDGGAPFYGVYLTSDDAWLAVGPVEPAFYGELLQVLGVDPDVLGDRMDQDAWPAARSCIAEAFATRPLAEWLTRFAGRSACVQPVLDLEAARKHEHALARGQFVEVDGVPHPAPAPRFSRSALAAPASPDAPGSATSEVLSGVGVGPTQLAELRAAGVVA